MDDVTAPPVDVAAVETSVPPPATEISTSALNDENWCWLKSERYRACCNDVDVEEERTGESTGGAEEAKSNATTLEAD